MKKILLTFLVVFAMATGGTALVHASVGVPDYLRPENLPTATRGGVETPDDYAASGVQLILGKIISVVLMISGAITVWFIANTGFWMAVAMGKGEMIDQQKKALFWQIMGLLLIIASYVIVQFIVKFSTDVFQEAPASAAPPVQEEQTGSSASEASSKAASEAEPQRERELQSGNMYSPPGGDPRE